RTKPCLCEVEPYQKHPKRLSGGASPHNGMQGNGDRSVRLQSAAAPKTAALTQVFSPSGFASTASRHCGGGSRKSLEDPPPRLSQGKEDTSVTVGPTLGTGEFMLGLIHAKHTENAVPVRRLRRAAS